MFPLYNFEQIQVIIGPSFKSINIVMFRILQIYISDTNKLLYMRSLKQCKTGLIHEYMNLKEVMNEIQIRSNITTSQTNLF